MTARLPTMRVTRRQNECPLVSFRGVRTLNAPENPSVYVDGTLMTNTCPLTDLSSTDVEAVEIYTSGATGRAGIQRNTAGVILIFRVRQEPAD